MAKLEKIEFFKMPNVRIIGFEVTNSLREGDENPVPALWEKIFSDGTIEKLKKLPLAIEDCTIGWMGDVDGHNFKYIAGVIAVENTSVPEGMQYRDLSECDIAKGFIYGNLNNGDVYMNAHNLTVEGIKSKQFDVDNSYGWSAEIYPNDLNFDAGEGTICYFCPYKK
jgi:AraC family transcriptional regulator